MVVRVPGLGVVVYELSASTVQAPASAGHGAKGPPIDSKHQHIDSVCSKFQECFRFQVFCEEPPYTESDDDSDERTETLP